MDGSSQHAAAFHGCGSAKGLQSRACGCIPVVTRRRFRAERRRPFDEYRTGGIGYDEVMARLADAIDAHGAPMRNRYQRLPTDPTELDARLAEGSSTPASAPTRRSAGRGLRWDCTPTRNVVSMTGPCAASSATGW